MTYIPGGGSNTPIATMGDVALSNPATGQIIYYDATTGKWENHTVVPADINGLQAYVQNLIDQAS